MTDAVVYVLESLAGGLINGFWISLLLAGLAAGVLRLIGRNHSVNASTRYGVWTVTLVAIFAAHVMAMGLVGPRFAGPGAGEDSGERPSAAVAMSAVDEPPPAPVSDRSESSPVVSDGSIDKSSSAVVDGELSGATASPAVLIDVKGGLFILAAFLLLVWFSRATASLASIVSSWRRVCDLKSNARTVDPTEWRTLVPARPGRSFAVAESADVSSPVAAGLNGPVILLPIGLRDRLTTDEFRQVLLHEVAHLERFDDWTILIQRIGEALLWHHPAMWKLSTELQETREIACDDWVVSRTRRPEAYVHSIGRMIELNLGTRSLGLAPGLAAGRGDLMGRMRRLMDQKLPDSSRLSGEQIAVAGGLVGLVLVLVAVFVPLMRLAFSFGDGEAKTYLFGERPDDAIQIEEVRVPDPLPPLAPIPKLPDLPPLPDLPSVSLTADAPPPRAASIELREMPPPPPVSGGASARADNPPPPPLGRASDADLSVRSWIGILDSISGLQSNGARREVLQTVLTMMPDEDRVVRAWLEAVSDMSSSGAQSELLVQMVNTVTLDEDRIDWIRSAVVSIPSRGDRQRILRALSDTL